MVAECTARKQSLVGQSHDLAADQVLRSWLCATAVPGGPWGSKQGYPSLSYPTQVPLLHAGTHVQGHAQGQTAVAQMYATAIGPQETHTPVYVHLWGHAQGIYRRIRSYISICLRLIIE